MKTLIVVRHAKSSWEFPDLEDTQRPLLDKGKKRTQKVINHLIKSRFRRPDLIFSSHAVRALETARMFARAFEYPENQIIQSKTIYEGDKNMITDQFFGLDEEIKSVMIVGHNPTLTYFVNQWLSDPIEWIPTSGVVVLRIPAKNWQEIHLFKASSFIKIFPKEI
ncbi:MAG: SixA phosphatase family protein [Bacteroidales bacterium]